MAQFSLSEDKPLGWSRAREVDTFLVLTAPASCSWFVQNLHLMLRGKKLIAVYVIQGALPYVVLSLVLLTAILFTQQTGRFAELAIYTDLPLSLAGEIAAALLPSVLILTLPVAVLAGIMIGLARMGSDSEIVAIRAAGVGTWSLLWPALLIGLVATTATTFLHLKEAPEAARDLRPRLLELPAVRVRSQRTC